MKISKSKVCTLCLSAIIASQSSIPILAYSPPNTHSQVASIEDTNKKITNVKVGTNDIQVKEYKVKDNVYVDVTDGTYTNTLVYDSTGENLEGFIDNGNYMSFQELIDSLIADGSLVYEQEKEPQQYANVADPGGGGSSTWLYAFTGKSTLTKQFTNTVYLVSVVMAFAGVPSKSIANGIVTAVIGAPLVGQVVAKFECYFVDYTYQNKNDKQSWKHYIKSYKNGYGSGYITTHTKYSSTKQPIWQP